MLGAELISCTAYQTFIDLLTNQGKVSSSAFLQLYSTLSEAPDPVPLLEASVESLVVSEETLPRLTAERDTLRERLQDVTSRLETAERRLGEEQANRGKLNQEQDVRSHELEARWTQVLQEKQENWESREKSLEEKLEHYESLVKELRANQEVSQRLDQDTGSNPPWNGGKLTTELEMVHSELEKTTSRLTDMEARNEQLRLEIAQATTLSHNTKSEVQQEDAAFQALQTENSALLRRLESARLDKDAEKRELERQRFAAERQEGQLSSEVAGLKARLEKMADYDELRRELEMIKLIEFPAGDDEASPDTQTRTNGVPDEADKESLEQLLASKNKKLSNELTMLRVSHEDLQRQIENLRQELSRSTADLEESRNLTATLENDLLRIQGDQSSALPSSGMSSVGSQRYTPSARKGRASPTSSIVSGFHGSSSNLPSSAATLETLRGGGPVGGGSGILPMVQAQRDRFKQKISQLEDELSKTYAMVTSLRSEVASLQKDNLSLYEKTRYVSTYNRGHGGATTTSASAYAPGPAHTTIQMSPSMPSASSPSAGIASIDRYKNQYETNLSPFAAFRGRESARAYQRMNVFERATFSMTRIVLANRTSRNLFAGYCLTLHLLVFVMLSKTLSTHAAMGAYPKIGAGSNGGGYVDDFGPEEFDGLAAGGEAGPAVAAAAGGGQER